MLSREASDRHQEFCDAVSELLKRTDPDCKMIGNSDTNRALVEVFRAKQRCVDQAKNDAWERACGIVAAR